ncbi:hypothetical protein BS78_06G208700 [Paspalum vaginatum]|nr:hypothetical protein BS78_06G208700 [Paspalum vaginatum]
MAPQGNRQRTKHGDGDGVDRLSDLPDVLLLHILDHLRDIHAALRTSVLSNRWHGLWTGLLELTFREVDTSSVEATLEKLPAGTALNFLEVCVKKETMPEGISSLLRAAAKLAPKKLTVTGGSSTAKGWGEPEGNDDVVDLPCLHSTVSLKLDTRDMFLLPPPVGVFVKLTNLCLAWCHFDPAALLPLCPNLKVLVSNRCSLGKETFGRDAVFHSSSLEELVLKGCMLSRIDIVVPLLKKLKLKLYVDGAVDVSFSAPMVDYFDYYIIYEDIDVAFDQLWRLDCVRGLLVHGEPPLGPHLLDQEFSFEEAIAQLRMPNFYALDLVIFAEGHVFGPMLLHLLRIRPVIRRLQIFLEGDLEGEKCSTNCTCKQPDSWTSKSVALADIQVVEIDGLTGEDHELDLLKLLFRSATLLKRMTLRLSDGVSPSTSTINKLGSILMEYPNVRCVVNINGVSVS